MTDRYRQLYCVECGSEEGLVLAGNPKVVTCEPCRTTRLLVDDDPAVEDPERQGEREQHGIPPAWSLRLYPATETDDYTISRPHAHYDHCVFVEGGSAIYTHPGHGTRR